MSPLELKFERKRLESLMSEMKNTCGSCNHWMHPQCPREKTKKVSSGEWKCQNFSMSPLSISVLEKLNTNLKALDDVKIVNDFEIFFKGLNFK